jgi:hypothetical protein
LDTITCVEIQYKKQRNIKRRQNSLRKL